MTKLLILTMAAVTAACSDVTAPDDRWERPENIAFAPSLNVDISQMTRSPTGLYWQDLTVGTGLTAGVGDSVSVHYTGWLPDGTMFDTSHDEQNVPIRFPLAVGLVIRGWDEGIVGMRVGGRRKLVIRPELAYGSAGKGPIPPLATLVFDVELLWVKK